MRTSRTARAALAVAAVTMLLTSGCDERLPLTWKSTAPPSIDSPEGFARLWSTNCAGCHGADGSHGPARPMRDAVYLASVSDAELKRVIGGGSAPGTLMPGFARSAGGALAEVEIDAIISGMRRAWGDASAKASTIPFAAPSTRGSTERGKIAFDRSCVSCHSNGNASNAFYLQLVSDQSLRSTIIFGRPDLGMPGAEGPFPGRDASARLTAQEVDDIVAWLAQRRSADWPPKSIERGARP